MKEEYGNSQVYEDEQLPEQVNRGNGIVAVLDAISVGVEQLIDPYLAYRKTIAQMTVSIAQKMGIPTEESQTWAEKRSKLKINTTLPKEQCRSFDNGG